MKLLAVVALHQEAKAVLGRADRVTACRVGPYAALRGSIGESDWHVVVGGIGPLAAASATSAALASMGPFDLAISAGIAGSLSDAIGDAGAAVVADEIVVDGGAPPDVSLDGIEPFQWPPTSFRTSEWFTAAARTILRARSGAIITVSSMTVSEDRRREVLRHHPSAIAEAMEGAGVAAAASSWSTPYAELRTISNRVGRLDDGMWTVAGALEQLERACSMLGRGLQDRTGWHTVVSPGT